MVIKNNKNYSVIQGNKDSQVEWEIQSGSGNWVAAPFSCKLVFSLSATQVVLEVSSAVHSIYC